MTPSRLGAIVVFAALAAPAAASAALGGDASSVEADRVQMRGALRRVVRSDAYTLHELQAASGVVLREYVSPSGTVFAVAWEGAFLPDMRQLLGVHFDRYTQAAAAARRIRRGRAPRVVEAGDLVFEMTGHPRAFVGRAYLRTAVPRGVQVETIR